MMLRFTLSAALFLLPSFAWAQVVQLPTFHQFGVNTTVSVPDRGTAHLGSIRRAAESSSQTLLGPRLTGRSMSLGSASAHVQIIDLAEMDRQLLGRDSREQRQPSGPQIATRPPEPLDPVEAAKQLVRDARRCAEKQNYVVADYYYRMAIRKLPKDLALIAGQEYERFQTFRQIAMQESADRKAADMAARNIAAISQ